MTKRVFGLAVAIGALLAATAFAQAQAPGAPARGAQEPAPSGTPARGGGQGVGSQGDGDDVQERMPTSPPQARVAQLRKMLLEGQTCTF